MKKFIYTLILLLSCNLFYAQQQDLESLSKKDLIAIVAKKDQEINKIARQLSVLTAENQKDKNERETVTRESKELKRLLTETTNRWLKEVFIDKYITNKNYFLESNIPVNNDDYTELKKNFDQYDIIIKSVLASNPTNEHQAVAQKALDFNESYLTLLRIRDEILPLQYSEEVVIKTLQQLDTLPKLQAGKLQETKTKIIGLLKNYNERNCMLKLELDNFSKVDQEVAKAKYKGFEKDARFKDYPYFIKILQDIQKNVNLYTADSLPCNTIEAPTEISEMPENSEEKVVKEGESLRNIEDSKAGSGPNPMENN